MPRDLLGPPAVPDLSSLPIGRLWPPASWLLIGLKAPSGGGIIEKGGSGESDQCSVSIVESLDVREGGLFCPSVSVCLCFGPSFHVVCLNSVIIYKTTHNSIIPFRKPISLSV